MEIVNKIQACKPNEFLEFKEIEISKIKNTDNYESDYFILEINGKEYMFNSQDFKKAISNVTK